MCPEPTDTCYPTCVNFDAATGAAFVTECDCREPSEWGLTFDNGLPFNGCVVADNGTGTITHPPAGCEYLSPDEVYQIIDGLPPGTTIELDGPFWDFLCPDTSGFCSESIPPGICEQPGGNLGGDAHCSVGTLEVDVTGTGSLAGFNRHLAIPMNAEGHTGPRSPGDPVQAFPAEMFQLQGELFGDPDFCTFRFRGGSTFGMPSPGSNHAAPARRRQLRSRLFLRHHVPDRVRGLPRLTARRIRRNNDRDDPCRDGGHTAGMQRRLPAEHRVHDQSRALPGRYRGHLLRDDAGGCADL